MKRRFLLSLIPVLVFVLTAGSPAQDRKDPPKVAEPKPGSIYGRTSPHIEKALREGGGSKESEAAVVRGLRWLKRNQQADGSWKLDGNFNDRGTANDIAGTAFGLLPFLGAGKTHKPSKNNDYDVVV